MTEKPKFEIGETVFAASFETVAKEEPCPDCAGKQYVTVIMGNGDVHSLDCERCFTHHLGRSRGTIIEYQKVPTVVETIVTGVRVRDKKYEYETHHSIYDAERLFLSKPLAQRYAQKMAEEFEADERKPKKMNPRKTWAWNATYHRKQLKQAQRDIEYHTRKLAVAQARVKEDKK